MVIILNFVGYYDVQTPQWNCWVNNVNQCNKILLEKLIIAQMDFKLFPFPVPENL